MTELLHDLPMIDILTGALSRNNYWVLCLGNIPNIKSEQACS